MQWYKKLHWQILAGLGLGLVYGIIASFAGWSEFTKDWIAPFGTIFLNLLKLIAIPLVLTSLVCGVASLSDTRRLSRLGGKTILLYLSTTAVAITVGLLLVNVLRPGRQLPAEIRSELSASFEGDASGRFAGAEAVKDRGPLQAVVDIVPENFFGAAASNRNMLQLVFVALLVGIALVRIPRERGKPVLSFFEGMNHVVIDVVHIIMLMAPLGVFGLIASTISDLAQDDPGRIVSVLRALGFYSLVVVTGLVIQVFAVYPTLLRIFTKMPYRGFFSSIGPAQLLAFSTSSSGATLPVTMDCCERRLGVSKEVSSFVLPLGATINMDGTALYQAVAAVFIADAMNVPLAFGGQLTILLTALLASIGTAAVPGAGIIMLIIILEAIGVPAEGIALILGVDRILDMLRTTTNVTGDATVASVVAATEGHLGATASDPDGDENG